MKFIFSRTNTIILLVAIIITVAAYIIMRTGDKVISPVLLIIAYVVLFPLAIITGINKKNKNSAAAK